MVLLNPRVSIVIPSFNSEKYLSKAIESCLVQDYESLEILVIDDHSTDRSFEVANSYAIQDSRVRCYHNERKGANAARNYGSKLANGHYIQFLDSDDYLLSRSSIRQQVNAIPNFTSEAIIFCESASVKNEEYDQLFYRDKYSNFKDIDIRDLIFDCIIQTSQIFIPKSLFDVIGPLDEQLIQAQEHDFNVRAASRKIKFIYNPNYCVAIRSNNRKHRISNQDPRKTISNDLYIINKFNEYITFYVSNFDKYSHKQLVNEVVKYLLLKAQIIGNTSDFETLRFYEKQILLLKRKFGLKFIHNYKSILYTFLINIIGIYKFEYLRIKYLYRIRKAFT